MATAEVRKSNCHLFHHSLALQWIANVDAAVDRLMVVAEEDKGFLSSFLSPQLATFRRGRPNNYDRIGWRAAEEK